MPWKQSEANLKWYNLDQFSVLEVGQRGTRYAVIGWDATGEHVIEIFPNEAYARDTLARWLTEGTP